jgi:signal transduction histidine kinase
VSTTSPPGQLRAKLGRHSPAVDVLIALAILAISVPAAASRASLTSGLLTVALAAPLVVRRRWPTGVFAVIAAVALVQWFFDVRLLADVALLVALYTVAAQQSRNRMLLASGVLEVGVVLAAVRWSQGAHGLVFVFLTGMATAAAVLGDNVRTRRAYLASLEDRAERLERERDQQGRLAAAAERARIARELHDIVAHNLSVMIALADGAGFMADSDPPRSARAMEQVSRTGRDALNEMRRLLGVLRDDESTAALAPQPGLPELDALLEQVRGAGLPVALETSGQPVALSAGAELTVFRLVQEALTNTLKHGGPEARATVRLRYEAGGIDVEVTDDGRDVAVPAAGGQGLSGMRERVAAYGGSVDAGPRPVGGWRVHARLDVAA